MDRRKEKRKKRGGKEEAIRLERRNLYIHHGISSWIIPKGIK